MRFQTTIILAGLLTACAAEPFRQGGSYPQGWHSGSAPRPTSESKSRRQARPEAEAAANAVPGDSGGAGYRVVSDGTVGCADPQALRLLRDLRDTESASPRALAEAHRNGRCMTVFRASQWKLESAEGEMMRLSLQNPSPGQHATALYFLRGEVEAQP